MNLSETFDGSSLRFSFSYQLATHEVTPTSMKKFDCLAVDYVELPIEVTRETIIMSTMNGQSHEAAGQDPKLITNGLDDADILAFISSLIDQNSDLAKKFEQIDALMKLAEEQVQTARAEAEKIITEANQIAEKTSQEKVSTAQQKAQELIRAAEEQASRIISEAKQKARAVEWQARQILNAAKEKAEKETLLIRQEAQQLRLKTKPLSEVQPKVTAQADIEKSRLDSGDTKVKQALPPSGQEGEGKAENSELYDGTVELVILPPIAPERLLKLVRQLRRTRQISIMNLDVSLAKGVKIKLFLRTRIPLLKILEAIPEVEKVSGELKKANGAHNYPQTRDELSAKSILVQIKRR
jgi:cell division septum initiation protein DivIVA